MRLVGKNKMKKLITEILDALESHGYEAYLIGGFVRDYLLHKESLDVDICTSALPNDLERLFKLKPNQFGGIHFKKDKYDITITSFRQDLNYVHGFPQEVKFNVDLKTDLARRDFTINAIYMTKDEQVLGPTAYLNDLHNKVIRMIGDPLERIQEDPSRIIRALRFKVDLGFTLEEKLAQVIKENKDLLNLISKSKKNKELAKVKNQDQFLKILKELDYI